MTMEMQGRLSSVTLRTTLRTTMGAPAGQLGGGEIALWLHRKEIGALVD